jgi:hypothetical protein
MLINAYGFRQSEISSLSSIDAHKESVYKYKTAYFLYKPVYAARKLLIIFNGALRRSMAGTLVFRGYNYSFDDACVLCIADSALINHPCLLLSWYVDLGGAEYNNVYREIVDYIYALIQPASALFTGTSGGGLPAVRYAGIYSQSALISNSQIFPEEYFYHKDIIEYASSCGVQYDTEAFGLIGSIGAPKEIIMYQNIHDAHHYRFHYLPFVEHCVDLNLPIAPFAFSDALEDSSSGNAHTLQFPSSKSHKQVIDEWLSNQRNDAIYVEAILCGTAVKVACRYQGSGFVGPAEFAFYIFNGSERILILWYSICNGAVISIPQDASGPLSIAVFARDSANVKRSLLKRTNVQRIR